MSDIVATISGAIETAKKLYDISQKLKDVETQNLIADLRGSLADLKMQIADLKEENLRLSAEVRRLVQAAAVDPAVELKDGLYYVIGEPGEAPDGPYCQRCYDADSHLMHVTQLSDTFRHFGKWKCPQCKTMYA